LNADGTLNATDWYALGSELRRLHDAGVRAPNGSSPLVSKGTLDYYASLSGSVAIPEPSTFAMAALAATSLLRRRRYVSISCRTIREATRTTDASI